MRSPFYFEEKDMRRKEISPLKTPRDKINNRFGSEWIPNIVSITGDKCAEYMEKLQWLSENPRQEFRIDNGHGERDVNIHWRYTKK